MEQNTFTTNQKTLSRQHLRCFGIKELASIYFPNICPGSASVKLKKWIRETPSLLQSLKESGYQDNARILTVRQTELIFAQFGNPLP